MSQAISDTPGFGFVFHYPVACVQSFTNDMSSSNKAKKNPLNCLYQIHYFLIIFADPEAHLTIVPIDLGI